MNLLDYHQTNVLGITKDVFTFSTILKKSCGCLWVLVTYLSTRSYVLLMCNSSSSNKAYKLVFAE